MTATYKNFKVKTSHKGNKASTWDNLNMNNHMVKVTNTDNNKSTTFEFWCSRMSPTFETEYDVLNAFQCFVSDALSGEMELTDFLEEFGYLNSGESAKQGIKAHRACQKSFKKLSRIFDGDMYGLVNELSEQYA